MLEISESQIEKLKDIYASNKEDLERLEAFIKEHGSTNEGLTDATESFEQGYNNALWQVFNILGIPME